MGPGAAWGHVYGSGSGGVGWIDGVVVLLSQLRVFLAVAWLMLDTRRRGWPPRRSP